MRARARNFASARNHPWHLPARSSGFRPLDLSGVVCGALAPWACKESASSAHAIRLFRGAGYFAGLAPLRASTALFPR
eukprot:821761-Alexandrium_andersonii.AAC.1